MKCKDCTCWGCQYRSTNAEQPCVFETPQYVQTNTISSTQFILPLGLEELSARFMMALIPGDPDTIAKQAVEYAAALLKALRNE